MTYHYHSSVCQLASGRTVLRRFHTGELAIEDDGYLRELTCRELEEYWRMAEEKAEMDAQDRWDDEGKNMARTVMW